MKKILTLVLASLMIFSFTACGGAGSSGSTESSGSADMSAYPQDISEWTGQNFIDYFKAQGLFVEDSAHETWLQDHASYWAGTPVSEMAGWWDIEGIEGCMMIAILKPDLSDSSESDYNAWMDELRSNKLLSGDAAALGTVDHLVGNVAFAYTALTPDDESLAAIEAAYSQFLTDTGFTAEF